MMKSCILAPVHFSHSWDRDLHSCVSQDKTAINGMHGFQSQCVYISILPCCSSLLGRTGGSRKLQVASIAFEGRVVCNYLLGIHRKKRESAISFWFTPCNTTSPPLPSPL